jgi:hypothetical protein
MFCKNVIKKPYMFWSLSYDHPQGSSFVPSALPLLRLFASSFALFSVWLYVSQPDILQTGTPGTHSHKQVTDTHRIMQMTKQTRYER